jgi:subtilase family serine protease
MRAISVSRFNRPFPAPPSILLAALICPLMLCATILAQDPAQQAVATSRHLITQTVDESQLTTLSGNTNPLARPEFDLGTAAASLPIKRMLLVLKRSPEQESTLEKLLDDQQNKTSPSYHHWLTPEQFGQQFGPSDADLQTITGWLQSHGFEVGSTKGRTVLEFSGSASQVQEAFHTTIRNYLVNGEQHWANASDPQIPAALAPAVAGLASLNNFPRKAMSRPFGQFVRDKSTGKLTGHPLFTFAGQCDRDGNCYALGPYDFATIYNLLPLWNAGTSGQGQTIAIVGESNIKPQDVTDFRNMFGLVTKGFPVNNVTTILNGPDPGLQADESEADIDTQWSGAVAPNATVDFVVSESTESTAGIDLSAVYIIENNLAPVMSESYGFCELGLGASGNQFFNSLWQQAAAQGITVFISSGDSGSAGCDFNQGSTPQPAQFGLAVSGYASTPYNVAVGGTDFNDLQNATTYWNTTPADPTTQETALGYIPETTWNDSCTNGILATLGYSSNAETNCNNTRFSSIVWTVGGSGGKSNCTNPAGNTPASCSGGYAKPSWQSGTGVPADGKRDIPDVSLFASNGFMGNFYVICQSDSNPYNTCNTSSSLFFAGFGGTSVSSPAFAGIMALINQQTGERQGNANYVFYKLAAQTPASSCNSSTGPASTCIFNDVTSGTIAMPCASGSTNCTTTTAADAFGVLSGYSAGTGYDLATGLGSVNVNNLVTQWNSFSHSLPASKTVLSNVAPLTITHGQSVNFSITVAPASGTGPTPTGLVSLEGSPTNSTQGIAGFNLTGVTTPPSGTVSASTNLLPGGVNYFLSAHYSGDSNYAPSDSAPVSVTVNKESSQIEAFLVTFDFNGNLISSNTTSATYGSPYLLRVNVKNAAGHLCSPINASSATGCPTGQITLTDNGKPLDAGTYSLNSYGYLEDQIVQLAGGTNSITAQYSGDNSFSPPSVPASPVFNIAPASTTMGVPSVSGGTVGMPFQANVVVRSSSFGAAPTGTVTFLVNGNPVSGTISYSALAGTVSNPTATLTAYFGSSPSVFASPGAYTISASYSGDGNYGASSSPSYSINVKYPAPSLSTSPLSLTVAAGSSVTVTTVVDTGLKNVPVPTGTVSFLNWGPMTPISGTETYSTITDSNGNVALQASLSFVPGASVGVSASYGGDSNYPAASGGPVSISVTGSDFVLVPNQPSLTVARGDSALFTIFVQGQSNYAGIITFSSTSCSGLPNESSCVFSPTTLNGVGWTNLIVSAAAPHANAALTRESGSRLLLSTLGMPLAAIFLIGISRRNTLRVLAIGLILGVLCIGIGCGGGSGGSGAGGGGGGSTDPGTPVGTYAITVMATSVNGGTGTTHTATFNLIVQ